MNSDTAIFNQPTLTDVVRLLLENQLPVADLNEEKLAHFYSLCRGNDVAGIVGVELLGKNSLLRSLVVDKFFRGQGLAIKLVEKAETHAQSHGVKNLFLLTNTAESFFITQGYSVVERSSAPTEIRSTPEFSELCPGDTCLLMKTL